MMSVLMSHVKWPSATHVRIIRALGFAIWTFGLNPATPATSTEVSITPLRACGRCFGGNRDLRFGSRGFTMLLYGLKNILFAKVSEINRGFTKRFEEFCLPSRALSAPGQVSVDLRQRKSL